MLPVASLCGCREHDQRGGRQRWLLPEPEGDSKTFLARQVRVQDDHSKRLSHLPAWRRASRAAGLLSTSVGRIDQEPRRFCSRCRCVV